MHTIKSDYVKVIGGDMRKLEDKIIEQIFVYDFENTIQTERWIKSSNLRVNHENQNLSNTKQLEELLEEFVAQLRLTLLFTDNIILSYADLFDGILFLILGPTLISELLGFSTNHKVYPDISSKELLSQMNSRNIYSRLPITVIGPAKDLEQDKNLDQLKDRVYNHLEASTKQALKSLTKSESDFIYNWMVADYRNPVDINNIDEFIRCLKDEWFNAILDGRIVYKNWDREDVCFNNVFCPIFKKNMDYELDLLRANLKQYPLNSQERIESIRLINVISQFGEEDDLSEYIGKEVLSKSVETSLRTNAVSEPNTKRKDILNYIDKCSVSDNAKYLVFSWWNNIYIKTIADKYRTPFLKFSSFNVDDIQERFNKNDLLAFRIQSSKISSNKNKNNRKVNTIRSVQIPGILIETMMNISTPLYSQIRQNVHRVLNKEKNGLSNEKIFDISLLANDYLSEYKTKKQRWKEAFTPLFNTLVLGVMLFLFESGLLNNRTRIGFIIWIIILAISSIPFDKIKTIVNIRRKEISATLVIDYDNE